MDNIDGPNGNCAISGYDIDTARQDTLFVFILFHTSQKKQNHEKTQSLKNATTFCRIDYIIIAATCCTVGPIEKNPTKMRLKKFVKLTGHIYPCHSFTNIQYYEAQAVTGNGN